MTKRKMPPSSIPHPPSSPPMVSLVGAGPGDPGLITVAGLDRLKEAHVIVYDRLVSPALLGHARPDAELVYVGKIAGESHDQDAINGLLIEKAGEGKRVVRLKGGDPFVFGRGGEEAEALRAAAIPFDVVPGVTSATAVPAYAGIPVTHRGLASSFAVITGHEADASTITYHLPPITSIDTLVFLMGTKTLPDIVENLIANGRSPHTPVAVIQLGTTPEQRTVTGTLADIAERVRDAGLTPPAVTVVGEVVRLRETISWFAGAGGRLAEGRPLFGKRVLITRTRRQASALARLLAAEGAIPIELPAIEIERTANPAAVDAAASALARGEYAWTVFTSANAVDLWFAHLRDRALDARAFGAATRLGAATKVAAIGPATAEALAERGITADLVPDEYVAEAVVEAMPPELRKTPFPARPEAPRRTSGVTTPRILVPRAESARPELVEGLRALGAQVDEVTLYRAAVPQTAPAEALSLLREGAIDIVTFTSSSTVRNLAAMLDGDLSALSGTPAVPSGEGASPSVILSDDHARARNDSPPRRNLGGEAAPVRRGPGLLIACIGPITAMTAKELGLRVDVVAEEYTVEGLVQALRNRGALERDGEMVGPVGSLGERYRVFFREFVRLARARGSQPLANQEEENHRNFRASRTGFRYKVSFDKDGFFRVELRIDTGDRDRNARIFDDLRQESGALEANLGRLFWYTKPDVRAHRIYARRTGIVESPLDELEELKKWGLDQLVKFQSEFDPRLEQLRL